MTKRFGDVTAVDGLSMVVEDGEFLVLLGPSGCGKTTALRMIAGLEDVTSGTVSIGEQVVNDVPPKDRDIAMVFQSYALYPHLTVRRNIEFPLQHRGLSKEERASRIAVAAEALRLTELLDRKPRQLSGGQRQRVAVARAIVRQPRVFLMDEPLSNLDAMLRIDTRADIVALQRQLQTTTIYVTHDQVEAMTMGHRIAVLRDGRLQQIGPPVELYERPTNTFVATFLGNPGMCLAAGAVRHGNVELGGVTVATASLPDRPVTVGVRPESMLLSDDGVPAVVEFIEVLGADALVLCKLEQGERMIVRQPFTAARPRVGEPVRLQAAKGAGVVHLFDPVSGDRIEVA